MSAGLLAPSIVSATPMSVGPEEASSTINCLPPSLYAEMLQRTERAASREELAVSLAQLIRRFATDAEVLFRLRLPDGSTRDIWHASPGPEPQTAKWERHLTAGCQRAVMSGAIVVRHQQAPACTVVAGSVPDSHGEPEALAIAVAARSTTDPLVTLAQLAISQIVLWRALAAQRKLDQDLRDSAAVVELLQGLANAPNTQRAGMVAVGELVRCLPARRVAVGLRTTRRARCQLLAVSGVAQFDRHSLVGQAMESVMDEAAFLGEATVWPCAEEGNSRPMPAHKQLAATDSLLPVVVSTALHDQAGVPIGAVVAQFESRDTAERALRVLLALDRPLAAALAVAQRAEGGASLRAIRAVRRFLPTSAGRACLAAAGLVIAVLLIPVPYMVHCDCRVEPATRRYISAPFDGTLEKALVKPGDLVQAGQVLALMEGRELRWKRASVAADRDQATKKRDSAQVARNYAEQQIAALEVGRLDQELNLLDHRSRNLEISCPVSGVVVSGDLERAEGAPLTIGQTLFEIAPLESMIIEVAVPDEAIAHVQVGQLMTARLDAYPGQSWQEPLTQLQPRAEIRDEANVFVAEATFDNRAGQLRPGMEGRAKVATGNHTLGWIAFHKPWEWITKKLAW